MELKYHEGDLEQEIAFPIKKIQKKFGKKTFCVWIVDGKSGKRTACFRSCR
jgi:hypothetical protein